MDPIEFNKDRQIDPGQLDVEAARQADLFFKYAEQAIAARGLSDRRKLEMDLTEARLHFRCREHPEQFGLERITEAAVAAAVKLHEDYRRVCDRYLRARERSMLLDKAVDAMEQRKRMIEVLVTLHGQQYFAGPSVPRDLVSAWKDEQRRTERRVTDKQHECVRTRTKKNEHGRTRTKKKRKSHD